MLNQEDSDFVIDAGDIAYCAGDQACWDRFFMTIEPLAARKAWMVCYGNHDVSPEPVGYRNRFTVPASSSINGNIDYFYSFDVGPIHFISISTELYFLPQNATVNSTQQLQWLQQDLVNANLPSNRAQRPWIVLFGHRPIYCSHSYIDCQNNVALFLQRDLEPLFFSYGVDLAFWGHIHSMEKTYPISFDSQVSGTFENPMGTVHVVNGAAGQFVLGPFTDPQPAWSAWRTNIHGFSRLNANLTSFAFEFVAFNGTVLDSFNLGQPFKGRLN
jgi:hypothetical protein